VYLDIDFNKQLVILVKSKGIKYLSEINVDMSAE
jgi:hypothetical protein